MQAEEKAALAAESNCLKYGCISEVIPGVANAIFETPIGRASVIGSNGLVESSPIICIVAEDDFSTFEMLCERDIHSAELREEGFAFHIHVEIDEMKHC